MQTIPAKTIVTNLKGSANWFGVNYNMNIYRGCCHGCIYCDSRSECYHIDGFDEVKVKENALEIIRNNLRSKVRSGVVGTGAMSDPYNPFEKQLELTRKALQLIDAYGFGAAVVTKSDLITRDIDILKDIKTHSPVIIKITVTCADDKLCKIVEPNAPLSSQRFAALKKLSAEGIFCGILLMPVLPFIEDNEDNILKIVQKGAECGVRFIYPAFGVTLRQNQREYFYKRLDESFAGIKQKYINHYGYEYNCVSPNAKRLWKVFKAECDRLGILYKMQDIISCYKQGYSIQQLSFF